MASSNLELPWKLSGDFMRTADEIIKTPRQKICAILNRGKITVESLCDNSWTSCGFSEDCWSEALH